MGKREEGKTAYEKLLKKYADQVIALVPEDKRAEAEKALASDSLFDELGESVLMRSDYSKQLDQVRDANTKVLAYNDQLNDWYKQKQGEITAAAKLAEENARLKAALGTGAGAPPATDPDDPVSTAALQKMSEGLLRRDEATKLLNDSLGQLAQNAVGYSNTVARLTMQHYKNFGEELDPQTVVDYFTKNKKTSLETAYAEMYKDRYEAKAEEQKKKEREKLEADIRTKVEDEFRARNPQMPYIVTTEASVSPILEAMKKKDAKASDFGTEAALDEYYRMQRPAGS